MLTKLMKKAITLFEKEFKGQGVEIRNVYVYESHEKAANFKIECNLLALNKYYFAFVYVNEKTNDYRVSELTEC